MLGGLPMTANAIGLLPPTVRACQRLQDLL